MLKNNTSIRILTQLIKIKIFKVDNSDLGEDDLRHDNL